MTWQSSPAARIIRRAADLNDVEPDAARKLWAMAAPLEIAAAEAANAESIRIERLLSAATCLIEAGLFEMCMIVIEALLGCNLDHATMDQVEDLFWDVVCLTAPPVPCNLPN